MFSSKEELENLIIKLMKEGFLVWFTSNFRMTSFYLVFMTKCIFYTYKTTNQFILNKNFNDLLNISKKEISNIQLKPFNIVTTQVWNVDVWIEFILSDDFKKTFFELDYNHTRYSQLLIVQGISNYFKNSKKILNQTFKTFYKLYETSQSLEFIKNNLKINNHISFELSEFYLIWLQVYFGIIVHKTKSEEESKTILQIFNKHKENFLFNQTNIKYDKNKRTLSEIIIIDDDLDINNKIPKIENNDKKIENKEEIKNETIEYNSKRIQEEDFKYALQLHQEINISNNNNQLMNNSSINNNSLIKNEISNLKKIDNQQNLNSPSKQIKCGNCGEIGHTRNNPSCPLFNKPE
jgi:hypothetical protein